MACRGCSSRTAQGCLCHIDSSMDAFTKAGSGTAASPYTLAPILDPDPDNLLSCSADGLLAALPAKFANPPAASLTRTTTQSIPHNTLTLISFNLETYDTDTMHSVSVNPTRLTFTQAGFYTVTFHVVWYKHATGDRIIHILKNGTDVIGRDSKPTGGGDLFVGQSVTIQEQFSAADYVEGQVHQTSGSSLYIVAEYGSPLLATKGWV